MSEMKLRSEENLDSDEGLKTEAGAANLSPIDPFEEGEHTLFRSDRHQQDDLKGSATIKMTQNKVLPRNESLIEILSYEWKGSRGR